MSITLVNFHTRKATRALLLMAALVASTLALSGCALRPLLSAASVAPAIISPNADGSDDVALIKYHVGRPADVSIYLVDSSGQRHYFRESQRRSPGNYDVYWGGAINEQQILEVPGGQMLVQSRVLPDGDYTWVIEATDDQGRVEKVEGQIRLELADTQLPELRNFVVAPREFTPNQDSIHDRVSIAYYLTKDADQVQVYLVPAGSESEADRATAPSLKYPIAEEPSASTAEPGKAGYHGYDYDGGVDLNAEPPPDGDYVVFGEAQDKVGNRVVVSSTLTILEGGKPRAEIVGGEIDWQGDMNRTVSVPLGDELCFTATVENIGPVPIRTAGPWPGQTYKFSENYNALAGREEEKSWYQQAGAWRFGVNFDTTGLDFPYRWAIGRPEDLEERVIDGVKQYYLLPGKRGQVSGCIEFDQKPPVGTTFWWGGLIHEFVEVANNSVDQISVVVGAP